MTRLTVSLDDDLYALAKAVAKAQDCSLSAAVNRMLRRTIEERYPPTEQLEGDVPVVRCRGSFTAADVDRIEALDDDR